MCGVKLERLHGLRTEGERMHARKSEALTILCHLILFVPFVFVIITIIITTIITIIIIVIISLVSITFILIIAATTTIIVTAH